MLGKWLLLPLLFTISSCSIKKQSLENTLLSHPSISIYITDKDGKQLKIIETKKITHITREFDGLLLKSFDQEMSATINFPGARLTIIDSPGGEEFVGRKMIEMIELEKLRGVKQICVIKHIAHSMAFNFLTHCDIRFAVLGSFSVVHKIAFDFQKIPEERVTSLWLKERALELALIDEPYRQANARAMHLSIEDYDLFADQETSWRATTLLLRNYLQDIVIIK